MTTMNERLLNAVRERLEKGAHQYGDVSFEMPFDDLLRNIEEEVTDIIGWAAILFERIRRLRERAADVERQGVL